MLCNYTCAIDQVKEVTVSTTIEVSDAARKASRIAAAAAHSAAHSSSASANTASAAVDEAEQLRCAESAIYARAAVEVAKQAVKAAKLAYIRALHAWVGVSFRSPVYRLDCFDSIVHGNGRRSLPKGSRTWS